ncbi:calcium-binding protein [Pseudomonas sp. Z4-20]|uniref:calcium-binding protein n=1 Tax=Pseudomonas sp. Z4-20 TaxID=2817414 RepID=UPI003DA8F6A7
MVTDAPLSSLDDHAVVITDIGLHANEFTSETIDFSLADNEKIDLERKLRRVQLDVVDKLYGPLNIASLTVTRSALDTLGATIDGQPLNGQNCFFRTPNRFFINALQFSSIDIEARMKTIAAAEDYRLPTLLFEMASQRSPSAVPLLSVPSVQPKTLNSYRSKLEKLLIYAQRLEFRQSLQFSTLPWVNQAKSIAMTHTGLGLQGFGIYSGLRGLQDAIRNKDSYNTIFNSASLGAEVSSIAIEAALTRQATHMLKASQGALKDFTRTTFAVRLGRGAGLIAGALTLPIDIISAINAFKDAAKSTGKDAIDHYVSAALSITSAVMTVSLGIAALAGFSAAGPVGLVAGLILALGAQIWGAVRQVDEIADYIELTALERLRTGWFAFWLIDPDRDINDRYLIAKATAEHTKKLEAEALYLLQGPLKDTTEAIVNGAFNVELEDVPFNATHWLTGNKYVDYLQRPKITGGDDTIDARGGVTVDTPGAVLGTSAEDKNIHWYIGGGSDTVWGDEKKQNIFRYGEGIKNLTGGEKDDVFIFEGINALPNETDDDFVPGTLDGGQGNDTLILAGRSKDHQVLKLGYRVDLSRNQVLVTKADNTSHLQTVLKNIENIEIHEGGTHTIKGSDAVNIIKSYGCDTVEAGGGDDRIYLLGKNNLDAKGGAGNDSYVIAHRPGRITLTEDGLDGSIILLDWRADLIKNWQITQNDLVLTSHFDANDLDVRQVVIRDVYKRIDGRRSINNKEMNFLTKDGYQLTPDLPEFLEVDGPFQITIAMTKQGTLRNPWILKDWVIQTVPHDKDTHYYFSRFTNETTLNIKQRSAFTTTLHLDYASAELTRIEADYSIYFAGTDEDEIDNIKYGKCGLTLSLGKKRVRLLNLESADERFTALAPGRRMFSKLRPQHTFILVMNDGKSYRLTLPDPNPALFLNGEITKDNPLQWKTDVRLPLKPTKHLYPSLPPLEKEPFHMRNRATCARLNPPSDASGVEVLIGEGSTYLIHLKPETTLRLSTPGALANANPRLPAASTWELDATQLGRVEITLLPNRLKVGSVLIHLPEYGPEDLIDPIRVITAEGIVHAVDVLFEEVYIDALDARYFRPPKNADDTLAKELSSLTSEDIKVLNVAVRDGSAGTVSYNWKKRNWYLRADSLRVLDASDLRKTNRCEHQIARYQDFVQHTLNENADFTVDILQVIRTVCITLSDSVIPNVVDDAAFSAALQKAFGTTELQYGIYYGQDIEPRSPAASIIFQL